MSDMDASELFERVSGLPANWKLILGEMSHGLSNAEIANKFGYSNDRTVGTIISEINKHLGIGKKEVYSRIKKRNLAEEAFRLWEATNHATGQLEDHIKRLRDRGYVVETVFDIPACSGSRVTRVILMKVAAGGRHRARTRSVR
jgi:hypothetical protein